MTNRAMTHRRWAQMVSAGLGVILAVGLAPAAVANASGGDKVTLCHATASRHNPYVVITVDAAGAFDGHYSEHQGPVFSSDLPKHVKWGDIIPQFTYQGVTYGPVNGGRTAIDDGCSTSTGGVVG